MEGIDGLDPELFTTREGVEQLAQTAKTHYDKLREFGADVPPQDYAIDKTGLTIFLSLPQPSLFRLSQLIVMISRLS